ncbi:MAG: 4Fe-4S dicluster domain-containing protein [Eubacteriales bacterium]|nr:4Fe-4S dicluster domain-containing protein [Eubacteriales bacterium]
MKGIYTNVNDIRKRVFAEVAKLAYDYKDGDLSAMHQIPYNVIPGIEGSYRNSAFLERAIVSERTRLALGLDLRDFEAFDSLTVGAEKCIQPETYYEKPLMNVIKFACHKCPDNVVHITDGCQLCLAHPCMEVCPKNAISVVNGRNQIDQSKCIKCGKCIAACPYHAIMKLERPCAKACGVKAIGSDANGAADIDYEKCVSCGQCQVNCPFGAISDKSQIFQTIQAIKSDVPVYAAIAPAVTGQFGPAMTPERIRTAFQALGFKDVYEVAIGADLCTIEEAKDFIREVPDEIPFMGTSCCPAWSKMAKQMFPEQGKCISMALTPMVLTGRLIKRLDPGCKVAFIGPCAAKKLEARRRSIRSDIDFVLTFEEVFGMFTAKGIDFSQLEEADTMHGASADGRGFAFSGGVANAVVNYIKEHYPDREVKTAKAEGLEDCRKMLLLAKAGKYNGYLLEGMGCPGGCVAGAGTLQAVPKTVKAIQTHMKVSTAQHASESDYANYLNVLEEDDHKAPMEE